MLRAIDLLRRLSSGFRPVESQEAPAAHRLRRETSFDALLASARHGQADRVRPVRLAPGVEVDLSDDQLERVGISIDAAEATGAGSVLLVIEDEVLGADVGERSIVASGVRLRGRVLNTYDAVVVVPEVEARELRERLTDHEADAPRAPDERGPLVGLVRNASMGSVLELVQRERTHAPVRDPD